MKGLPWEEGVVVSYQIPTQLSQQSLLTVPEVSLGGGVQGGAEICRRRLCYPVQTPCLSVTAPENNGHRVPDPVHPGLCLGAGKVRPHTRQTVASTVLVSASVQLGLDGVTRRIVQVHGLVLEPETVSTTDWH